MFLLIIIKSEFIVIKFKYFIAPFINFICSPKVINNLIATYFLMRFDNLFLHDSSYLNYYS